MEFLFDFIRKKDVSKTKIFPHLKCSKEEGKILQELLKKFLEGIEEINVYDFLRKLYSDKQMHLSKLSLIKNLVELGWINYAVFENSKTREETLLGLLHKDIYLSHSFLKLLEEGEIELSLPEVKPYTDHLEYLQDQFLRIELYHKIGFEYGDAASLNRAKDRLKMLEKRIEEKLKVTTINITIENFFKKHKLNEKERIIFLSLLKEEYGGGEGELRDMNNLIKLISADEYERIENRGLLEEDSKLIEEGILDYEEMLNPFGGIGRSFFITEEALQEVIYPKKKQKVLKLDMIIKEQDIFELIEPKTSLEDVVLNPVTRKVLDSLLKQMDKKVARRLKEWKIKPHYKVEAKIIFYGPPGTGKTITALSLAKSLKKQVLSFDCSNILSMYVGESEKNVKKIFDTYDEISKKARVQPVLLLNEADQFLSARVAGAQSSADKMHNQMQNIFLEQIEKFDGVLIATTNLLESIDPAFSRRFNFKIEFKKPNFEERVKLWKNMLPEKAQYEDNFSIEKLAQYDLTGGQINLVIKNTAYRVAIKDNPVFTQKEFIEEIKKEKSSTFEEDKQLGFLK
jgi:AAA+ superfamily predicted ATPase